MQEREYTMNSEHLQKKFPDFYQDLFSRCPFVCSAPRAYAITGDHTVPYGGMSMIQRTTLRNYVGLEPINKRIIRLAHPRRHVPDTRFIDHDFSRLFDERIAPLLLQFLKEHSPSSRGFAVHVLTEGPPPRITGGYGSIAAALAAVFHLAVDVVSSETLQRWADTATRELLTDNRFFFDPIFRFAIKIKTALDLTVEGGGIVFASYVTSSAPTLFFWQKTFRDLFDIFPPSLHALTVKQAMHAFASVPYWGMNVDELVKEQTHIPFTWPVDAAIVNVGKIVSAGYAQRMLTDLEARFRNFSDTLDNHFEPLLARGDPLPPFYHLAKEQRGERLWESVPRLSIMLSLTVITRFLYLCGHGVSDESLHAFLRFADTYRHWLSILGFDLSSQNHLATHLHYRAFDMNVPIAVKPYAYGGEILLMSPVGAFRDTFFEEMQTFQKETGIHAAIDYVSWRDGHERRGLLVEQDFDHGITATMFDVGVVQLFSWDTRGAQKRILVSHDRIPKERSQADIFFDCTDGKIFIQGKPLTSRELHSTKKTLEIVDILLSQAGEWVPASQFPSSSYIDRNEMQSKIISPLRAAVKKKTKKSLLFEIKGSIGKNFALRFSPRGLRVGFCRAQ